MQQNPAYDLVTFFCEYHQILIINYVIVLLVNYQHLVSRLVVLIRTYTYIYTRAYFNYFAYLAHKPLRTIIVK